MPIYMKIEVVKLSGTPVGSFTLERSDVVRTLRQQVAREMGQETPLGEDRVRLQVGGHSLTKNSNLLYKQLAEAGLTDGSTVTAILDTPEYVAEFFAEKTSYDEWFIGEVKVYKAERADYDSLLKDAGLEDDEESYEALVPQFNDGMIGEAIRRKLDLAKVVDTILKEAGTARTFNDPAIGLQVLYAGGHIFKLLRAAGQI
eukprot:TRINITY_DN29340_c0_g1_i1.p1 TRINITY_DN29340_c0_g1~~TRINITY_DN29340_c0_g1_i1.p1  ORF type:complete len:201 (-),score=37.56 TRINITY_DN29340_c0_g1_i1:288-890(-)